jgi:hypothetical protein
MRPPWPPLAAPAVLLAAQRLLAGIEGARDVPATVQALEIALGETGAPP